MMKHVCQFLGLTAVFFPFICMAHSSDYQRHIINCRFTCLTLFECCYFHDWFAVLLRLHVCVRNVFNEIHSSALISMDTAEIKTFPTELETYPELTTAKWEVRLAVSSRWMTSFKSMVKATVLSLFELLTLLDWEILMNAMLHCCPCVFV